MISQASNCEIWGANTFSQLDPCDFWSKILSKNFNKKLIMSERAHRTDVAQVVSYAGEKNYKAINFFL